MPLNHENSEAAVKEDIKTEMAHGKPQKQAVAIALNATGRSNKDDAVSGYSPLSDGLTIEQVKANNRAFWKGTT